MDKHINGIQDHVFEGKRVLIRVDYNVSLLDGQITNDERIKQTLPTLQLLLERKNKLILVSHLGRPDGRDPSLSLKIVAGRLSKLLHLPIRVIDDFLNEEGKKELAEQKEGEVFMLENIRFYDGEKTNDSEFAKNLAGIADVYVNDAFGVSHRVAASVVGVASLLPSYAGLLMEKEISAIMNIMHDPKKPVVAIIGGAKTSTKLPLLRRLVEIADYVLLGGGIANTFLKSEGFALGKSLIEEGQDEEVKEILTHAKEHNTLVVLPRDSICAITDDARETDEFAVNHIPDAMAIFDIGPETQAMWGNIIAKAETLVWNGPVGYVENPLFGRGSDFLYYSITQNTHAFSLVGGGDTLAVLKNKEYLEKITHISTGGGAMLEFIEKGTLPGIEALKQ